MQRKTIVISGASGFVGQYIFKYFIASGVLQKMLLPFRLGLGGCFPRDY
ncbi:MAG: hypothetical protein Q9M36_11365 [Sulfurovum sp.]|nr:hypothetical protein [Sulfurovum sp.]